MKRDGDDITRWEREKDEERDHKEKMVMRERERDRKSRKKGINQGLANGCSGGDHTSDTLGSAPLNGLSLRYQ